MTRKGAAPQATDNLPTLRITPDRWNWAARHVNLSALMCDDQATLDGDDRLLWMRDALHDLMELHKELNRLMKEPRT